MRARDDLADLLRVADANSWDKWWKIADAVIAAGWRPPARKIETVEELEALPDGSLVCDRHRIPFQKDDGRLVALHGSEIDMAQLLPPAIFLRTHSPIAVLWEPGADDE